MTRSKSPTILSFLGTSANSIPEKQAVTDIGVGAGAGQGSEAVSGSSWKKDTSATGEGSWAATDKSSTNSISSSCSPDTAAVTAGSPDDRSSIRIRGVPTIFEDEDDEVFPAGFEVEPMLTNSHGSNTAPNHFQAGVFGRF